MDVLTLSLTDSFVKGIEDIAQVRSRKHAVNMQQNNVFQYEVSKPDESLMIELCKKGVSENNQ